MLLAFTQSVNNVFHSLCDHKVVGVVASGAASGNRTSAEEGLVRGEDGEGETETGVHSTRARLPSGDHTETGASSSSC